jgi:superfamily II DNA helicase RecQ
LKLGISALAINEDTLAAARARQENLWDNLKAVLEVSILLLSPEQLSSRSFDHLLQKKAFSERIAALGLDEMHLVLDWGNAGFREAFRLIGLILACLPHGTTLLGTTATLLVKHNRSFRALGTFFFNRRSNLRTHASIRLGVLRHGN